MMMFLLRRLCQASKSVQATCSLNVEMLEDRTVPTLLGEQLFPSNNPWNQPIVNAPVAANSVAIINNIISLAGNGEVRPDFSQDNLTANHPVYGIPYNVVHGNSMPKISVVIGEYADQSDVVPAPIPANAVLEGDDETGPVFGLANRGDSHLIVWDVDTNIDYEFFGTSRPDENSDGKWHAQSETVWNMNTNQFHTIGFTSADAAGLPILPGLIRPDEALPVSQGGQGIIDHAIRFTLANDIILNQFIYPATHAADPGNNNAAVEPPMGTRFRLKASVDIADFDPESKIIAQAMKTYGLILADNGSNFFISGSSYSVNANNQMTLTWNNDDIQDDTDGLKSLTFSDFEVVNLTPVVTGLSVHSGEGRTQVLITGENFSGAAGQLYVYFGNLLAPSVQIIDDRHLLVTVPNGVGTVQVRVLSGQPDLTDTSQNVNGSIFGYGLSAETNADLFTMKRFGRIF